MLVRSIYVLALALTLELCRALRLPAMSNAPSGRRAYIAASMAASLVPLQPAFAEDEIEPKQKNLSPSAIAAIVKEDVEKRQFLASADLTRSIYDESALFTDEIDTYTLPKWIKGTKKLFNTDASTVRLVGDVLATDSEIRFRFDEDLQFAIPFKPTVSLTGELVLKRDPATGLINSYKENWDQSVNEVLKTAKF